MRPWVWSVDEDVRLHNKLHFIFQTFNFSVMQTLRRCLHQSLGILITLVMLRGALGFWPLTSSPVVVPDIKNSKKIVHTAAEAAIREKALPKSTSTRRKLLSHDESFLSVGCMPYETHHWRYVEKECRPLYDEQIAYYSPTTSPAYEILEGENHAMACARMCADNAECVFFQTYSDHPGTVLGSCTLFRSNYLPDDCLLQESYRNYDSYQTYYGYADPDKEGSYNFTRNAPCPAPTFAEFFSGYGDCVDSTEWTQMFGSLDVGPAGGWSNLASWDGMTTCSEGEGVTESDYTLALSGTPKACAANQYLSPATSQQVCTSPPAWCDPLPVLANGSCGWGRCLLDGECVRDRPGNFPYTTLSSVDGVCAAYPACDESYHVPIAREYNGMVYTGARVHMHADVEGRTGIFTESGVQVVFATSLTRAQCMGECGSDPSCNFAAFEDWGASDKSTANCFKAYCNGKLEQCFTPTSTGTYALFQDMDPTCEEVHTHAECKSCPPNSVSNIGSHHHSDCLCAEGFYDHNNSCVACPSGALSEQMESTNPTVTFSVSPMDYASDVNTYYWKGTGEQTTFLTSELFPLFSVLSDWPSCVASDVDPESMSGELFTNYPCVVKKGDHASSPERQCDGNSGNIIEHTGKTKNYMNTCPAYLFKAYIQDKHTLAVSQQSFRVSEAGWNAGWWYLTFFHSVHQIYHFQTQVNTILVQGDKLYHHDPSSFTPKFFSATACFCPPGFATDSVTGECGGCPLGTYSDQKNASFCLNCANGTTTSTTKATHCDVCSPGFYRMPNGTCSACLPGSYSHENNASACTACPLGSYSANHSSSECTPCPRGTYADSTGSLVCKACSSPNTTASTAAKSLSECNVHARPCGPGFYWMDDTPSSRRLLGHNEAEESKCNEVEINGVKHAYKSYYQNSHSWYKPKATEILSSFASNSSDLSWMLSGRSLLYSCAVKCVENPSCLSFLVEEKHDQSGVSTCVLYRTASTDTMTLTREGHAYMTMMIGDSDESFFMLLNRNHDCSDIYSVPGSCYPCPPGTWSNHSDALTCMACPDETASLISGSPSVNFCQPICKPGQYVLRNFSFNGTITAKTCGSCGPGTFSAEPDSASCTACAAGEASNLVENTACSTCLTHSTSNAGNTLCECDPGYTCNLNSDGIVHLTLGTYELIRTDTKDTLSEFIISHPQVFNDPERPSPPRTCTSLSTCRLMFWTIQDDWCTAGRMDSYCGPNAKTDSYMGWALRVYKYGFGGVMRSTLPYDQVARDNIIATFRDQTFVVWRPDLTAAGSLSIDFVSTPERPLDTSRDYAPSRVMTDYATKDWLSLTEPLPMESCESVYWIMNDFTNPGSDKDLENPFNTELYNFQTKIQCPRYKPFFVWVKKPDGTVVKCHVKIFWVEFPAGQLQSGHPDFPGIGVWVMSTYKDPANLRLMSGSSLVTRNLRSTGPNTKYHTEEYDWSDPYNLQSLFRVNGEPEFTAELLRGSKIYTSDPTPACSEQQQVEGDCVACPEGTGKLTSGAGPCQPLCKEGEFRDAATESCTPCPEHSYQDVASLESACRPCPAGFTAPGSGHETLEACRAPVSETACGKGSYNASDGCFPCPIGTFSVFSDQTTCTPCPEFMTTVSPGANSSTACLLFDCPGGNFLYLGQCTPCPAGTYFVKKDNECVSCGEGYTTTGAASTAASQCILDVSVNDGEEKAYFKGFRFRTTSKAYGAIRAKFLRALAFATGIPKSKVSEESLEIFEYNADIVEVQARVRFQTDKTMTQLNLLLTKSTIDANLGAQKAQTMKVKMLSKKLQRRVQLPYSLLAFQDETLRLKFRKGMARAAKVGVDDVVIVSVTSIGGNDASAPDMRRLLQTEESVNVDTEITTTEDNPVNTSLTDESLNTALATEGVAPGDLNPPDATTTTTAPTTASSTTTTPTPTTTTASSTTTPTPTTSSTTSVATSTTTASAEMTTPAPVAPTSTDDYGVTSYVHAERPCGRGYFWDSGTDEASSRRLLGHYAIEESQCNEVTVGGLPYSYNSYYNDSRAYYKPSFEFFLEQFDQYDLSWAVAGESYMTSCAIQCAQNSNCVSFLLQELHTQSNYVACLLYSSTVPDVSTYTDEYFAMQYEGIEDADQSFFMVMDREISCVTGGPGLSGTCKPCPIGTYSALSDVTECTPCPENTTTPHERTYTADFCFAICQEGQYISQNFSITYEPKGPDCKTITVDGKTHDYEDMFNGSTTHRPAELANRIYTTEGTWPVWTAGRTAEYKYEEDCAKICAMYDRCVLFHVYMRTTGSDPVICDLYNSRDTVDSAA